MNVREVLFGVAAACMMVVGHSNAAHAAIVDVPDMCFFTDLSSVGRINMVGGDNLIRIYEDGSEGVVTTSHKIAFVRYNPFTIDGCADNPFMASLGWEGFVTGDYSHTLGVGNKPDDMWVIRDENDDGLGTYDTLTGTWSPGPDDYFYTPEETFLNGIALSEGGGSELPVFGVSNELPSMTVPEPTVGLLLSAGVSGLLGLSRRRSRRE